MGYYESAEEETITHARALQELRTHGVDDTESLKDFYESLGRHESYDAQAVLSFLGY